MSTLATRAPRPRLSPLDMAATLQEYPSLTEEIRDVLQNLPEPLYLRLQDYLNLKRYPRSLDVFCLIIRLQHPGVSERVGVRAILEQREKHKRRLFLAACVIFHLLQPQWKREALEDVAQEQAELATSA